MGLHDIGQFSLFSSITFSARVDLHNPTQTRHRTLPAPPEVSFVRPPSLPPSLEARRGTFKL